MSYRPHPTKPGHYQIEYWPNGKKGKRETIVQKCDAAFAAALDAELRNSRKPVSAIHPPIKDIIHEYLAWCEQHYSKGFNRDLKGELPGILQHFGPYTINHILMTHFDAYKAWRREGKRKTVSPRTVNKCLNIVKGLISWGTKRGYGDPLPFKVEPLPYQRPIPRLPSPDEFHAFIAEIDDPQKRLAVYLMVESGLRFSEAMNLTWNDINLDDRTMIIHGKLGKWRLAALTDSALKIIDIRPYLALAKQVELPDNDRIFDNPKTGKPFTTLKTLFRGAGERAGVKIHPHLLRHLAATRVLQVSDLRTTQEFLGHSTLQATTFYTHITRANMLNAAHLAAVTSEGSEKKYKKAV